MPRLQRLLDAAEAAMATGEPDADAIAEADRVDRLLVRNPAT
ncbi:hypothetical protein [Corynebacterium afermentans]|nr:hypothetical protein [Corynebacterium afermentans]